MLGTIKTLKLSAYFPVIFLNNYISKQWQTLSLNGCKVSEGEDGRLESKAKDITL